MRVYDNDLKGYHDDCDICQGGRIEDTSPCSCGGTGTKYYPIYLDADEIEDDEYYAELFIGASDEADKIQME